MLGKVTLGTLSFLLVSSFQLAADAQTAQFDLNGFTTAAPGTQRYVSNRTGEGPSGYAAQTTATTGRQASPYIRSTTTALLAPVFGMSGSGYLNYNPSYNPVAIAAAAAAFASSPANGNLADLSSTLPGSQFANNHPRRTEVLEADSNLYNAINADYGSLNGQYNNLATQALNIKNEEEADAAVNGGYITQAQQSALNGEEASLSQSIANAKAGF